MFDSLRKKLSKGVKKLSGKIPEKSAEEIIRKPKEGKPIEKPEAMEEIIREPEKPKEEAAREPEYLEIPEKEEPEPERPEPGKPGGAKERPILRRISR